VRAGAAFRASPAPELFQAAPMQTLTYLVAFAGGLLWNFGFILLLNQRLIATSRDARDQLEAIFRTSPDAAFVARVDDHRVVEHTRCHTELLAKAVGLAGQFERDQLQLGELFIYLAHEVVAQHLFQEDRAFFAYL
jgi:hypothetical protein